MKHNKSKNEFVYATQTGKKYHFDNKCYYLKKGYFKIPLKEARRIFEGVCIRCKNRNNNNILNEKYSSINNNLKLNIVHNNRNYNYISENLNVCERQNSHLKKENFNNNKHANNNNLLYNIIETDEDKNIEDSNFSIQKLNNSFTDLLSSSSSFIKVLNNPLLFEEKSSDIDFNNFNGSSNKNKMDILHRNNFINPQKENNNLSMYPESEEKNSLNHFQNKNEMVKEEKNSENKINNINNDEVINLINNYKNKNNISNNNNSNINKENNLNKNYISDIKTKNININKPSKEQKNFSNSFSIQYNNSNNNSKIKNNINNKSYFISSSSTSNIKFKNKNDTKKEKDIIKILNETYQNSITLTNINCENFYNKTNKKKFIFDKGNFKFSFQVIPKSKNLVNIKIEFGFKIIYIEENDSNYNFEEESSESSNDSISLSNTYHEYYLYKKLNIKKNLKNIIVLINVSKGKFFIVKNQQNFDINDNPNIFFLKNNILSISGFQKIEKITEIIPIFKYNPEDLNNADILVNEHPISI